MDKNLDYAITSAKVLLAVETLEYHNKNWLSFSPEQISSMKQEQLTDLINCLEKFSKTA